MDPRKRIFGIKPARTTTRNSNQEQLNLNYFQQIVDSDTFCENAFRALKIEFLENPELTEEIEEEKWKTQFDVPIVTKY